jgi:His/Glu/Gln/Arg/opine family amino acid ABC transporter permease subunit
LGLSTQAEIGVVVGIMGTFLKNLGEDLQYLGPGFLLTIRLTLTTFAIGAVLGLILAILRMKKRGVFFHVSGIIIDFLRGTPMLVQLLAIYFFVGMYIKTSPLTAAIVGMSVNLSAYISEAYRGVLESIHKGQWEAARSMGMSTIMALRRIILPQALIILLPDLTNYLIMTLLGSSLASVVALRELTLLGQSLVARTFRVEIFFIVALLYFCVSFPMSRLATWMEKKWKHVR